MNSTPIHLQLKKFIRARREKVFQAWTKPEFLRTWIAPGAASSVSSLRMELKVGGSYRIEMQGEMGGRVFDVVVRGIYETIIPNELLTFTWAFEDQERRNSVGDTRVSVEFKDVDGGTEVILTHAKFATTDKRDGHYHGWVDCLEKLARICE
ncbi:MAG: SRPBCC domain-containing protein [Gammaproteobacteria bacterium]|nr:SRPBCC domain-containing protein [Gammaproteobacteria bacterium]